MQLTRHTTICPHCALPLRWRAVVSLATGAGDARCTNCNGVLPDIHVSMIGGHVQVRQIVDRPTSYTASIDWHDGGTSPR